MMGKTSDLELCHAIAPTTRSFSRRTTSLLLRTCAISLAVQSLSMESMKSASIPSPEMRSKTFLWQASYQLMEKALVRHICFCRNSPSIHSNTKSWPQCLWLVSISIAIWMPRMKTVWRFWPRKASVIFSFTVLQNSLTNWHFNLCFAFVKDIKDINNWV